MAHKSVYIGTLTAQDRRYHPEAGWYVLGAQFGPMLWANCSGPEEALHEWDERHGERVDWENDASTLADYGTTQEAQLEAAMNYGDIRINDGGTMVWVDPDEWVNGPFPTLSAAMRALKVTAL